MAEPFSSIILPLIISGLSGALQSGFSAYGASEANRRAAQGAEAARERAAILIRRLQDQDTTGLRAAASDALSAASGQIEATTANRGTFRSGRSGANAGIEDATQAVVAQLAQEIADDEMRREQLIAQIMAQPEFKVANPDEFRPFADAVLAGLGGLGAGAAQGLSSLLSTEAGLAALGLGGDGGGDTPTFTAPQGETPLEVIFGPGGQNTTSSAPVPIPSPAVTVNTGSARTVPMPNATASVVPPTMPAPPPAWVPGDPRQFNVFTSELAQSSPFTQAASRILAGYFQ